MTEPLLEDVFKISGVPTYTFVEPNAFSRLSVALRTPGRGVVIEGPSGIGKTTAVTRSLDGIGYTDRVQMLSARKPGDVEYISILPQTTNFGVVVVDDFHILPIYVKNALADYLKVLADEEDPASKLVIVGINRAGDALIRHAPDLNNRIDVIKFEVEPKEKVAEVVKLGQQALNVAFDAAAPIVEAAQGSFYLVQMLCQELCLEEGVSERQEQVLRVRSSYSIVKQRVMDRQERRFGAVTRQFARGTKFRPSGRAPYLMLLRWLAESQRWDIALPDELPKHPEHRASVGQVVDKGYLANLASDDKIAEIIHYDSDGRVLSVEDPHLIFYLRNLDWQRFARDAGFTNVEIEHVYDFALSFAGEDRPFADALSAQVEDIGFVVFYDLNEQHRILGVNVEEFLAPIYRSEARFVVAVLGPEYGERRWTRFESDNFKARFDSGQVIPVWARGARPSAFDETRDIGYLSYDPAGDPRAEAERVSKLLARKYDDVLNRTPGQIQLDLAIPAPTVVEPSQHNLRG
jgi:hypothetical protein